MTDYTKLVHDIRAIADELDCKYCGIKGMSGGCKSCVLYDAADAIEALLKDNIMLLELRGDKLPKHGKWVEDTTTYAGPGLSNYKCSLCGKICGTWRSGLKPSELPNWCGNCGADMRKMEVQQ